MIVRSPRPQSHFTVLDNAVLRNQQLTLRARGLLALLLSYPDNWRTSSESLARVCPDGRDAIRTTLRELEGAGYITRRKYQDELGRWQSETTVYDTPQQSPAVSTTDPQPAPRNPPPVPPALKEITTTKDSARKSVSYLREGKLKVCGQCSGTGWKPNGKSLTKCSCDSGLTK